MKTLVAEAVRKSGKPDTKKWRASGIDGRTHASDQRRVAQSPGDGIPGKGTCAFCTKYGRYRPGMHHEIEACQLRQRTAPEATPEPK